MTKVKFGLKNVHYAPLTFDGSGQPIYGDPVPIPGAVNLSLTKSGETYEFYGDDGVYYEVGDNSRMDGDLELALIPESFRTGPLGEEKDDKGVLVESAISNYGHFALLFEFTTDDKAIRHVMYNCTASQNTIAGATRGEKIEIQTETLNLRVRPLPQDAKMKARTGEDTDADIYSGWYDAVYLRTISNSTASGSSESGGEGDNPVSE